jgi:hypothetical protein
MVSQKCLPSCNEPFMSVQEIVAALPKLEPEEFRPGVEKVHEIEATARLPKTAWGKALLEFAGVADDLPTDFSINHDHYLYGTPKRA